MYSERITCLIFVCVASFLYQVQCYPQEHIKIDNSLELNQKKNQTVINISNLSECSSAKYENKPNESIEFEGGGSTTSSQGEFEIVADKHKVSYNGSQLWKISFKDNRNRGILFKLRDRGDLSVWGGNLTQVDVLINSSSVQKVSDIFQNKKIPYEVLITNLQEFINAENPPLPAEIQELSNRKGHRLTWKAYYRLNDIHEYLDYLGKTYPSICTVRTIGYSTEKRPIKLIKISNGNPANKAVWIDGGIHAREWISPATVTYILENIVENNDNPSSPLANIDWYVVPVVNPDGYEYSHTIDRLWRKNRGGRGRCSGVDLNRNFGYKWGGKGVSKNPCTEIYGGQAPFSEPETAAIKNFIDSTPAKWKAYLSFHSYGQYLLYPWGYDTYVTPDHADLQAVASKAARAMGSLFGSHYRYGPAASTLYPASGGSDDWAKGVKNIKYAYTFELRDTGRFGFILPSSYIMPTAQEALKGVEVIAIAAKAA